MPTRTPSYTPEQIRSFLLRYDDLEGRGYTLRDIAAQFDVPVTVLGYWRKNQFTYLSVDGPWQQTFQGKKWDDMPGHDAFTQRCNFYLFRHGRLRLDDDGKIESKRRGRGRGRPRKNVKRDETGASAGAGVDKADLFALMEVDADANLGGATQSSLPLVKGDT